MAPVIDIIDARSDGGSALRALQERSVADGSPRIEQDVRRIVEDVRERGDEALLEYEQQFDCPTLTARQLRVTEDEIQAAYRVVSDGQLGAVRRAKNNVYEFHLRSRPTSWLDSFEGVWLGQRITPVDSVGIYVPAKRAPLPSTVYMCAMPAQVADVERIAMCTPPRKDGSVDALTLVAAAECGVDEVYRVGGAQAVGALAFGTQTIAPVSKIVGPGNPWVTLAKKYVFGTVGIDSLAGPSELLIIADETASPDVLAADLLAQAEHTGDNLVVLVTPAESLADQVAEQLGRQMHSSDRVELMRESLTEYGAIILVCDLHQAAQLASEIAPEHLQLTVADPFALLEEVDNAGCVCLGPLSAVSLGDYAAGPSHVLPTMGTARFSSGLSVDDFVKKSSLIYTTPSGLQRLAPDVIEMAEAEGLSAHAQAVRERLADDTIL